MVDLRNAFGEIHPNLIRCALKYHHILDNIVEIVSDIYTNNTVQIAHRRNETAALIPVERGVLQE